MIIVNLRRQKGGQYIRQSILALLRFSANKGTLFEINQLYLTWPKMYQESLSGEIISSFIMGFPSDKKLGTLRQKQSRCPGMIKESYLWVKENINCVLMLNWIAWNRTVMTFKLRTYAKLNCLKWNCFCMLNWIVWKRIVLTFNCLNKNYTYSKLNCLK